MPTAKQYTDRIRRLSRPGLVKLWGQVQAGRTPGWAPGKAFEYLVLRAFELERADVTYPFSVRLDEQEVEQIDGAVHLADLHALVESKDESVPVGIAPIAKLRNQLLRRPPTATGLVFARSGFTDPARTLAAYMVPVQILLWEGVELGYALTSRGMVDGVRRKFRHAIEQGLPDFFIGQVP